MTKSKYFRNHNYKIYAQILTGTLDFLNPLYETEMSNQNQNQSEILKAKFRKRKHGKFLQLPENKECFFNCNPKHRNHKGKE